MPLLPPLPELPPLQERLAALSATSLTPTTSLRGDLRGWLGSVGYGGNQIDAARNAYNGVPLRDA